MLRCELTRAQIDDHVSVATYFGENPGVFLERGFRTSQVEVIAGPFETIDDAKVDAKLRACGYYDALPIETRLDVVLLDPIILVRAEQIRSRSHVRLDSFTKLEGGRGMFIGRDVHIASFCHLGIGGGITILEDGSSFGSGSKIISGSNVAGRGHGCSAIAPDAEFKRSFVHIKKNATMFVNAVVCPGVTVGENAVILPGAVVTKDVPAFERWGGVPARKVGDV